MNVEDVVLVGFNKRVAALDRETGDIVWQWKASQGSGFVSLVLDEDRLFVAVNGYTYCLDPFTGQELWSNPLKGFGTGATSLATSRGHSNYSLLGEAERQATAGARGGAAAAGGAS